MELKDRFNILKQAAQLAQSKGVLSLDDAVFVKKAFDCIENNTHLDVAAKILMKTVQVAQSKGVYSLKDAYLIYIACDHIEESIPQELPTIGSTDREEKDCSNETCQND